MTPAEFLQNFIPGDKVLSVRAEGEEGHIIIEFESGYEFVSGKDWKWQASEHLTEQERARWLKEHPGAERPTQ